MKHRHPGAALNSAPPSKLQRVPATPLPLLRRRGGYLLCLMLLLVAYVVSAKIGLHLAYANKNVTAVWPPTGIAVAALLLFGVELWPAIAVGAVVSNLLNGASWDTSVLIAVGNTLAPVAAWFLVHKVARAQTQLEHVPDVANVLLLGGPVAMSISATLGTAALLVTTPLSWSEYGSTWLTWWVGDGVGVILVCPLVLVAAARCWRNDSLHGWHLVEGIVALACTVGVSLIVFNVRAPLVFLILPIAMWASFRFFQLGAGLVVAVVAAVSISATVSGHGPLVQGLTPTASLISLQLFNGALSVTAFMLAAASLQHFRARVALQADASDLAALLRQERRAALDDMAAVVSHDLRTPLATIANSHYLLRELLGDELSGDARTALELAERGRAQAMELTEQILTYRRPRNLELANVDLRKLIDQAVETVPVPSGISTSVECEPIGVRVDPGQMQQILRNLIANAYEAMAGSGGSLQITAKVDGDTVVIDTSDTGPGFDEAAMLKVFEPFYSTKMSGTGLGLAIVHRLVEAHGGEVSVHNRPTGGGMVRVLLFRGIAQSAMPADS